MFELRQAYEVSLPVYSGPLDLLLQLIEREELDISRISLAQVTNQFLAHLRQIEEQRIHEIADFLVIAARLILIKSEGLLPRPPEREALESDPGDELARLLKAYKKYKKLAELLLGRQKAGLRTYLRLATPPKPRPRLDLSGITSDDLYAAMQQVTEVQSKIRPSVSTVVERPRVTIVQKIQTVARALRRRGQTSFFGLLRAVRTRTEIIVTFLAVLELVKQRLVTVRQEQQFGDIDISGEGEWVFSDKVEIVSELEQVEKNVQK